MTSKIMYRFFQGSLFFIGIRRKQLFLYPARPHIPATNKNMMSPLGMSLAQEHDNPDPFDNPDNTHYAMITKIPNDYDSDHDNLDTQWYPQSAVRRGWEGRGRRSMKLSCRWTSRRVSSSPGAIMAQYVVQWHNMLCKGTICCARAQYAVQWHNMFKGK